MLMDATITNTSTSVVNLATANTVSILGTGTLTGSGQTVVVNNASAELFLEGHNFKSGFLDFEPEINILLHSNNTIEYSITSRMEKLNLENHKLSFKYTCSTNFIKCSTR